MSSDGMTRLPEILSKYEADILAEWVQAQMSLVGRGGGASRETELRQQGAEFLRLLRSSLRDGANTDIRASQWGELREMLSGVSRGRGQQGYSPSETAAFVFSLKKPLFERMRKEFASDGELLARETWGVSELLDNLGLFTTEVYQKGREEVIARQQQEMLELSTPVVKLWEGVLALPLIGTLDSARTQVVMESLLQAIVDTGSGMAIIDITGVPMVDTLTAQHLIKTVTAARLMGADCIISGIRPQIAQTIVHLGVDLGEITTKSKLGDAFALALKRQGRAVVAVAPQS
jgi:rsbT co-antagonist protein RsbR